MPVDTSIYQTLRTPQMQDPLEQYGRLQALRNMLAQGQVQNLQLEQSQMQIEKLKRQFWTEEAARGILGKYERFEDAVPELVQTLGSNALPIAENIVKFQTGKNAYTGQRLEQYRSGLKFVTENIKQLFKTPESQRDQAYQMILQSVPENVRTQLPPVFDAELFQGYYDSAARELEDLQRREQVAKTEQAEAENQARKDWLEANPGKTLADYEAYLATAKRAPSYQTVEIVDRAAPGGHRTALFDPSTGQVSDPRTRQVIPNAQRYYIPSAAVQVAGQDPEIFAEMLGKGSITAAQVPEVIRGKVLQIASDKGYKILSDTERQQLTGFGKVRPILDSISELSERINTAQGVLAKLRGGVERAKAKANLDDDVAEYESLISGFTPMVARAVGHVGVLTEQDVQSVRALFPKPGESKSLRDRKIKRLETIFTGVARETERGMTEPVPEPRSGQVTVTDPRGVVHTFPDQASADAFKKAAGIP